MNRKTVEVGMSSIRHCFPRPSHALFSHSFYLSLYEYMTWTGRNMAYHVRSHRRYCLSSRVAWKLAEGDFCWATMHKGLLQRWARVALAPKLPYISTKMRCFAVPGWVASKPDIEFTVRSSAV